MNERLYIAVLDYAIDLTQLAASIRSSSNFRFTWQFFRVKGIDLRRPGGIRACLDRIILCEDLHRFLPDSLESGEASHFTIEPLHKHCAIMPAKGDFLDTLARAYHDRLGAYSPDLSAATAMERKEIESLFANAGPFDAFTIRPGKQDNCDECRYYNNHLYSNWFFAVAWDFTFFVSWPLRNVLWMGCLSDTD